MKAITRIILLAMGGIFLITACQKDNNVSKRKLDKITIQMECIIDGETVSYPEVNHMVFFWDGKLLDRIDYYDEGEYLRTAEYSYDEQNKVTTINPNDIIQSQTRPDTNYINSTYTFTYRNNTPETCTETVHNGDDVIKYIYHYYYK